MLAFRNLSIRRKLTLIVMVTTCTAILLACGAFLAFDIHTLRQTRVLDLETLAEVLGSNSTAALTFNDPATAREVSAIVSREAAHHGGEPLSAAMERIFASYVRKSARRLFFSIARTQRRAF